MYITIIVLVLIAAAFIGGFLMFRNNQARINKTEANAATAATEIKTAIESVKTSVKNVKSKK